MRPRIRTIKPEFFGDEKVNSVQVGARYLAIGLVSAADDRGRLTASVAAIRGHVFPLGDVPERQVARALDSLVEVQFAWRYQAGAFAYLWLPKFWAHQRINRPSESDLPPHPDDPYGDLPVVEAMERFKAENRPGIHGTITEGSMINHGTITEGSSLSRAPACAGGRSDPFPVVVSELTERLAACVRANDPKSQPDPSSVRWLTDMRLLLDDRDGDVAEVQRIIDWCQADAFWRSNILSPGKLRKQFTSLLLRAGDGSGTVVAIRDEKRARAERRLAAMQRVAAERAASESDGGAA